MSRTILANVEGFTPIIDSLVQEVGLMSAIVFGRVWRYCQMEAGVCMASMEKIGEEIGLDRLTVMRHVKELCERGYLEDRTPGVRNRPHIYADTGKAGMQLSLSGVSGNNTKGVSQNNTTVSENNSTVSQNNTGVSESNMKKEVKKQIKKEVKKEKPTTGATAAPVSQNLLFTYESSFGKASPMMRRVLARAETLYTAEWIFEALQIAEENGVKKWSYADAILKRWAKEGKVDNKHNSNGAHKTTWAEIVEESTEEAPSGAELKARIDAMLERAQAKRKSKQLAEVRT